MGGAESRIGVRAQLLSPGALGSSGLQQIGRHAAFDLDSGVAHGFARDVVEVVSASNASGRQWRSLAGHGGIAAENRIVRQGERGVHLSHHHATGVTVARLNYVAC